MVDAKIVLQDLAQRLRAAFPGKVKEVILHGSHLRGDAREDSDYDFVIVWNGKLDWNTRLKIHQEALETDLKFQVFSDLMLITSEEATQLRGRQPVYLLAFNHGLRAA